MNVDTALYQSDEVDVHRTKWKPYADYKNSGFGWLGNIPAHWIVKKLKHLCNYITDGSHISPHPGYTGRPYITVRDITHDGIDIENASRISEEGFRILEFNKCRPEINDVLITKDGTMGRSAVVRSNDFVVLESIAILRPNANTNPDFLRYCLISQSGVSQMLSRVEGIALKRLTLRMIDDLSFALPSLAEQKIIVKFLNNELAKIDTLIDKRRQLLSHLEEKRKSLINHAVIKGLNPDAPMKESSVDWLGNIPAHWEVKQLKHLTDQNLAYGLSASNNAVGKSVKLINVNDILRPDFIVETSSLKSINAAPEEIQTYDCISGDIFFVRSSFVRDTVGISACVMDDDESLVFDCHLFRMRPMSEVLCSSYLVNYLNSSLVRQRLNILSEGVIMTTIGQSDLSSIAVLQPPIEEQKVIASYIHKENAEINEIMVRSQKHIELLKEYRISFISSVITGKIDVRTDFE